MRNAGSHAPGGLDGSTDAYLPHSVEAEQQLLGALLVNNDLLARVEHVLAPESFYDPVHGEIYERIAARVADGRLASPVTLKTDLERHPGLAELGGPAYLARLAGAAIATGAVADYAALLVDLALRRRVIEAAREATEKAATGAGSGFEIAQGLEVEAAKLSVQARAKQLTASHTAALTEALREIVDARKGKDASAVRTGIAALDERLGGGLRAGQLCVVAGRPGMAKTSVAQNIAFAAAQAGRGVLFASLEMPRSELALRFVSKGLAERGVEISYARMRAGDLTDEELAQVGEEMRRQEALPIITGERDVRSVDRLRLAARRAERQLADTACPLGLVVIDYVQLVAVERARDLREKVTAASDACKSLALDLGVPVLALAQLNRECERRDPPVPMLSDMRESGRLEEDADIVVLLYRAEHYIDRDLEAAERSGADVAMRADLEADLAQARGRLDLIVAKQRSGATGTERAWLRADLCHVSAERMDTAQAAQGGIF